MAVAKFAEIKEYMLSQIEIGAWPEHLACNGMTLCIFHLLSI